jgi:hypothetical protein
MRQGREHTRQEDEKTKRRSTATLFTAPNPAHLSKKDVEDIDSCIQSIELFLSWRFSLLVVVEILR